MIKGVLEPEASSPVTRGIRGVALSKLGILTLPCFPICKMGTMTLVGNKCLNTWSCALHEVSAQLILWQFGWLDRYREENESLPFSSPHRNHLLHFNILFLPML